MMDRLLRFLWKLLSLAGLVLSLRRFFRTLVDEDEKKETRVLAGVMIALTVALAVWSLFSMASHHHVPAPVALALPATPPVTEIVVDFRDDVSLAAIARLDDPLELEFRANSPESLDERLMIADVRDRSEQERTALLAHLRSDPRVEAAEENFYLTLLGEAASWEPNDPRYEEQWNLRLIRMPEAWPTTKGKDVVIAVIDTGVAFQPEGGVPIASDLKETKYTRPYDFIKNQEKAYDDHGHGTHVAGTIAQSTDNKHGVAGIACESTIMPLKVLTSGGFGNISDIADAIHFAADNGAKVINMSLGGPRGSAVLGRACRYAHQQGVAIVCAAGNTASEGVGYPAAYPECIAVSAVNPEGKLTFYSTWGKELAIAAPGGEFRPGEPKANGILQNTVFMKKDTFEYWQGTSMASPHVAGVAGLLVAKGYKGPEAIRARLKQTAQPKGDPLRYGAGIVDAAKAVGASEAGGLVADAPRTWLVFLLTCAIWPLLAVLLGYGVRGLRPWLGLGASGFAVACLMLLAGGLISPLWLLANALLASGLGWLVLKRD